MQMNPFLTLTCDKLDTVISLIVFLKVIRVNYLGMLEGQRICYISVVCNLTILFSFTTIDYTIISTESTLKINVTLNCTEWS